MILGQPQERHLMEMMPGIIDQVDPERRKAMKKFMKQFKKSSDTYGTDGSDDSDNSGDSSDQGGAWIEEISSDEAPPPLIDIEK